MSPPKPLASVRARVLRWYRGHARDLPWRHTRDPYAVLVSEVMLQQTQVSRVLRAYSSFLRRFPTLGALARAPLGNVLRSWSGLGYNRRARDLWLIARARPRGLPRAFSDLDALPGIGAYTAGAVACFAYGEATPFADTNIRRVLGRHALGRTASEREARELDAHLLSPRAPARWHHALMDIGATLCHVRRPRCERCPLRADCRYRARPHEERKPRTQSDYATSDRRVRGRIVRLLGEREHGIALDELLGELADPRGRRLLKTLAEEGLVAIADGRARLPV